MQQIRISIHEHAWFTACLHDPIPERNPLPCVVVLPGGAFRTCSPREGEPVAMAFWAEGYQTIVVDYTTVTKKPDAMIDDPMQDVRFVLAWIQQNHESCCICPDQVILLGFSGGAHLAAAVSTHGPLRPNLLMLGYPGILHSELRALECPDIIEKVNRQTPPTFVFSTRTDVVTPPCHPLAFANALDEANIPFELHIFANGPHGLSLGKACTSWGRPEMVNDAFAQWFPLGLRWLRAMLTA